MRDARDHLPERRHFLALDEQHLLLLQLPKRVGEFARALRYAMLEGLVRVAQLEIDAVDDGVAVHQAPAKVGGKDQQQTRIHEQVEPVALGLVNRAAKLVFEGFREGIETWPGRREQRGPKQVVFGTALIHDLARGHRKLLQQAALRIGDVD